MVEGVLLQYNQIPYIYKVKKKPPTSWKKNYIIEVLPQRWEFWALYQVPQPGSLTLGGKAPRAIGFKGQWVLSAVRLEINYKKELIKSRNEWNRDGGNNNKKKG